MEPVSKNSRLKKLERKLNATTDWHYEIAGYMADRVLSVEEVREELMPGELIPVEDWNRLLLLSGLDNEEQ